MLCGSSKVQAGTALQPRVQRGAVKVCAIQQMPGRTPASTGSVGLLVFVFADRVLQGGVLSSAAPLLCSRAPVDNRLLSFLQP